MSTTTDIYQDTGKAFDELALAATALGEQVRRGNEEEGLPVDIESILTLITFLASWQNVDQRMKTIIADTQVRALAEGVEVPDDLSSLFGEEGGES